MVFSTKVVTKSRRNRSGRISTSRDVVGWVRMGETVLTTSRTIRGRGVEQALREVRAWLRRAAAERKEAPPRARSGATARRRRTRPKSRARAKRGS